MTETPTAIVTGAGGGIGAALVKRLAGRGMNVVLVDLITDGLDAVVADAGLSVDRYLNVAADVSVEADVERYVAATIDRFGRIDFLANSAGIECPFGLTEDQPVAVLDHVYNVNVRGVFLGLQKVLPVMKAQGSGAIMNTSSLAGIIGAPGMSPYIMSKHAVLPGAINTQMMRRIEDSTGTPSEYQQATAAAAPLGRYGEPDEVAAVMSFLLSDDASYVTSSLYTVDGGMVPQ